MNFKNWNTANKLAALVGLMIVFMVVIGGAGYYASSLMAANSQQMYNARLLPVKYMNGMIANTRSNEAAMLRLLLAELSPAQQKEIRDAMDKRSKENNAFLEAYTGADLNIYETERLQQLREALEKYRKVRLVPLDLAAAGKRQESYAYFQQNVQPLLNEVTAYESELADYNTRLAAELNTTNEAAKAKVAAVIIGVTLGAIGLAFIMAALITRIIVRPLREMLASISKDANGYITIKRINVTATDEVGQLGTAMNDFTAQITGIIKNVSDSAQQLAASSEEFSASADQSSQAAAQVAESINGVAKSADEQLAAAEETSSVVQQMSAGIQQTAATTNQVAQQAAQAAEKAREGGQSAETAVNQIVSIEEKVNTSAQLVTILGERSKEIGQIVETISGIAGQTNLLALNAAIEAARAGEQGRGFAVVAEEVRKLAEQSQAAAKQIAALIGQIQADTDKAVTAMNDGAREVKVGTEVVKAAGMAFQEIVDVISIVSSQVREISAATQQMASGGQVIVGAVQKIDNLSKKSASEVQTVSAATEEQLASMEEIAASSQALARLSQDLQNAVAEFRV